MDHAKRTFLKATVAIPVGLSVSAHVLAASAQIAATTVPALPPQKDVGGSLAGIDLSRFYQSDNHN
jgi:hypothetical protein